MKAIVAVDKNWGIGRNNDLLFSIPEDMKFFRQTTLNKVVVMGANTLRSFPNGNPLKNRTNIVLSSTIKRDDCQIFSSLDSLLAHLKEINSNDLFVIGGAMLYKTLLEFCDEIFVTKVNADGNATVFFENLDNLDNFKCIYESETFNSNGYEFKFLTYKNLSVKPL